MALFDNPSVAGKYLNYVSGKSAHLFLIHESSVHPKPHEIIQRPQHHLLAKLWHKNDVFDEKKKVCGGPKRRSETTRLTSPREV